MDVYPNLLYWSRFLPLMGGPLVIPISSTLFLAIPRCYKDVYVNKQVFPRIATQKALFAECLPLTFDINGVKSRANRHL